MVLLPNVLLPDDPGAIKFLLELTADLVDRFEVVPCVLPWEEIRKAFELTTWRFRVGERVVDLSIHTTSFIDIQFCSIEQVPPSWSNFRAATDWDLYRMKENEAIRSQLTWRPLWRSYFLPDCDDNRTRLLNYLDGCTRGSNDWHPSTSSSYKYEFSFIR